MKKEKIKSEIKIALAGVPNVGKSTVFNALTGLHRHTGNWTGKTVDCAEGDFTYLGTRFTIADLPGTYSLFSRSAEEKEAEDYILAGKCDAVLVVCDATCPERSLPLALQILEATPEVVVFFNLEDEAEKKNITIDYRQIEKALGVPVTHGTARDGTGLSSALKACLNVCSKGCPDAALPKYSEEIENKLAPFSDRRERRKRVLEIYGKPYEFGFEDTEKTHDEMSGVFVSFCDEICGKAVKREPSEREKREKVLDRLFTGKYTAFPIMILLLLFIFWLTLKGANYPSEALWSLFCFLLSALRALLGKAGASEWIISFICDGALGVSARVVSVMLPPMAIFFPLFTLLEDFGYLPRVAFNLDRCYKKCGGCGKQALCMCMGLGCNAVGISGCRIIDSKRERLIAVLTNSFIPCNGRFPILITLTSIFLMPGVTKLSGLAGAAVMTGLLCFSVGATFAASKLLSVTLLRGTPSSFTLEMPPFRPPKIIRTVVTSVIDRTLKVLFRAVIVAAPAGALIWLAANVKIGGASILSHMTQALDPIGRIMGFDGTVLTSFILGLPANETVLPIMLMGYQSSKALAESSTALVSEVLTGNGWGIKTAVCAVIFTLFHSPCSTALLTVKKETGSIFYTFLAAALPTLFGFILCVSVNLVFEAAAIIL